MSETKTEGCDCCVCQGCWITPDFHEAAEEVAAAFISENIGGPSQKSWWEEYVPKIEEALRRDGHIPTSYEVDALNGLVPEDGSDPEDDAEIMKDHGVPKAVGLKFPATHRLLSSQF